MGEIPKNDGENKSLVHPSYWRFFENSRGEFGNSHDTVLRYVLRPPNRLGSQGQKQTAHYKFQWLALQGLLLEDCLFNPVWKDFTQNGLYSKRTLLKTKEAIFPLSTPEDHHGFAGEVLLGETSVRIL